MATKYIQQQENMLTTWHMHVNTLIGITIGSTESWLSSLRVTGIAAGRVG